MPTYRKKPVEVEAYQFHNRVCTADDRPDWILAAYDAGKIKFHGGRSCPDHLTIPTLEGVMRADVGDWIIKGVKGELYPCKPDIFAATYERANPTEADHA